MSKKNNQFCIVTNQSGVGRGLVSIDNLKSINIQFNGQDRVKQNDPLYYNKIQPYIFPLILELNL